MKITYFGHACFLVEIDDVALLFDPFITGNELAKDVKIETIKPDYILISHGHFDHIQDAVVIGKQSNAKVIANYEITTWLTQQGLTYCFPLNIGGSWVFDFAKIKYVYAAHSSTLPDGSNGGAPGGFLIETNDKNFYFAGDTGLTSDMKLIGDYKQIDFAFLPIGDNFTMGIDNAILCSEFIKCNQIIGMHFDTFEYIKIDKSLALERFTKAGKNLKLMSIGESIQL